MYLREKQGKPMFLTLEARDNAAQQSVAAKEVQLNQA